MPASSPPPSIGVDESLGDQTDPHIDGSLVTYTSEQNGGGEIRWRDLVSGTAGSIPNFGAFDRGVGVGVSDRVPMVGDDGASATVPDQI